jgi:ATP-GRASP peptide maturase of grasp-with-spasm system
VKNNLVAILSEDNDISTDDVMDWLLYFNIGVIRVNEGDEAGNISIRVSDNDQSFHIDFVDIQKRVESAQIRKLWYRRGEFSIGRNLESSLDMLGNAGNYFSNEMEIIKNYLYDSFYKEKRGINSYKHNYTNKLWNLKIASQQGLHIPDTLVTNNSEELRQFSMKHEEIVIKPLTHPHFKSPFNGQLFNISSDTVVMKKDELLENISKQKVFLPTLFQGYIDKKIEIRSFYLQERFYSMAIFSQENEKTKKDFRNYDLERPNRCVPYKLPDIVEAKLIKFMEELNMNSGSFDIILTPSNTYVFLEVNPIGQFQWVSSNCNYYLEKQIAKALSND